jgi:hypothetical protein
MTEQEWLTCKDPQPMLEFLVGKASDRKLRLFAVACCRRIWHLLVDPRSRLAVETAERFADGSATEVQLETASDAACTVWDSDMERASPGGDELEQADDSLRYLASMAAYNVALPVRWWGAAPAFVAPHEVAREVTTNAEAEGAAQCALLRDIFGKAFHEVRLKRNWLESNDATIPKLAQLIYDERRFEDLPMMADALLDAGCTSAAILNHCRSDEPHVRGCWVLDLLLAKE